MRLQTASQRTHASGSAYRYGTDWLHGGESATSKDQLHSGVQEPVLLCVKSVQYSS